MKIFKYPLPAPGCRGELRLPADSRVVHVGLDPEGNHCMWCLVNTDAQHEVYEEVFVFGTGHTIEGLTANNAANFYHVGSYIDGLFVWHVISTIRKSSGPIN